MSAATVILGRDGMGDGATEADFEEWVAYVEEWIDADCGFEVRVAARSAIEIQCDRVETGGDEVAEETIRVAIADLWERWCSEGAASASHEVAS